MTLDLFIDILLAFINNLFILLALVFFYSATNYDVRKKHIAKSLIAGLLIGVAAFFLMYTPFTFTTGLIFDTRTILFSIAGHYFGFIPTIIGAVIAGAYRIYVGGEGMFVGVATIFAASAFGLFWKYIPKKLKLKNTFLHYYVFSLLSQGLILLLFFLLPNGAEVVNTVYLPVLIVFPTASMFICIVLEHQKTRLKLHSEMKTQRSLLKSSIDSTKTMEIWAIDRNYRYLTFNLFHQMQIEAYYNHQIERGDYLLELIADDQDRRILKSHIDNAMTGQSFTVIEQFNVSADKHFEISFTPIIEGQKTIGAAVFLRDISKQKQYEESILKLSYHDSLTNMYNRRFYHEKLMELSANNIPFTVITCDINGLKLVNDAFGHQVGDELLIAFATALQNQFHKDGLVFRIGGDEFIVLLVNESKAIALAKMDQLIHQLESKKLYGTEVSVSFGIAESENGSDVEDIMRLSEEQMYKHKLFETSSHRSEFIKTILHTLHEKNPREELHSQRVSTICVEIGKKLNMNKDELNLLRAISSLHDIGKIAIDEAILNKPGPLTKEEWEIIKRHPEIGYRIISTSPEYAEIAYDILSHHERYDGKGYPQGLKGNAIPIRARIVAIADAYDAMISQRTYRAPLTPKAAIAEIIRCKETQFDPELVDIFVTLYNDGSFEEH